MTGLALGLVLASAFIHASWNYLLEKSGGGAGLITAACAVSLVCYAPLALVQGERGHLPHSREGDLARRAAAACGMVLGIAGLALG